MMKQRYGLILLLFGLLLAGATFAVAQERGELTGRIAYVGPDFNVYSLDLQTNTPIQLTTDGNNRKQYAWPTWSTDGRLAYFVTTISGEGRASVDIFVSRDGNVPGEVAYHDEDASFIYAYWSPQNCVSGAEDCRDLAVLLQNLRNNNLFVQLVRDSASGVTSRAAGTGGPFYYSWSPSGEQMLWQRGGQQFDVYDTTSDRIVETLRPAPGLFNAPMWSPIDDRWLLAIAAADRRSTEIIVTEGPETTTLAGNLAGPVAASWSPDGSKVAYTDRQGPILVVDVETQEIVARTPVSGVLGYYWSPDSSRIAYITFASPPGSSNVSEPALGTSAALVQITNRFAWSVLDIDDGDVRRYPGFVPTQPQTFFVGFFDQYSQSHRVWSPDGRFITYGEVAANGQLVVNVLDATRANAIPRAVAEGFWGVWSFE